MSVSAIRPLAGDGDGAPPEIRFLLPGYFDTGTTVTNDDLALGQFNNDGFLDVAVTNQIEYALRDIGELPVLLGDGEGRFSAPLVSDLPVTGGATSLDTANLNGDTIDDLVAVLGDEGYPENNRVAALVGLGDGTFEVTHMGGLIEGGYVVGADFNGDGSDDVAFADGDIYGALDDFLSVAFGNGDGTFGPYTEYEMQGAADEKVEAADVNGDDLLDLVYNVYGMVVRLNLGNGAFGPEIISTAPGGYGDAFTLGDFNGDGIPDVATGDNSGGHVTIGLGVGDGHFAFHVEYSDIGWQVNWTTSGDFTGDGRVDLIAAADWDLSVLLVGRGDGTFTRVGSLLTAARGITLADVTLDGLLDVVALNIAEQVVVSPALRPGFFRAPFSYRTPIAGFGDWPMRSGDVNGDGHPDLVIAVDDQVASHLLRRRGIFRPGIVSGGLGDALSLALADVNEDGMLDAVVGTHAVNNVRVALGHGDGSFGPPVGISNGSGASVLALNVADFNQDGHLDIVSNTFGNLSLLPGNGDGTFGPRIESGQSSGAQFAAPVADFDGDGLLDAASVNWTGTANNAFTSVFLNLGNGDGTFTHVETIGIGTNVDQDGGRAADLDGDGDVDLAIVGSEGSHTGSDALVVMYNTGGTLDEVVEFYDAGCSDLDLGDLNGDQRPDAATACDEFVDINANLGDGSFGPPLLLPSITGQISTVIEDFTRDGRPDVVVLTFGEFTLYVNVTR